MGTEQPSKAEQLGLTILNVGPPASRLFPRPDGASAPSNTSNLHPVRAETVQGTICRYAHLYVFVTLGGAYSPVCALTDFDER